MLGTYIPSDGEIGTYLLESKGGQRKAKEKRKGGRGGEEGGGKRGWILSIRHKCNASLCL